MALLSALGAAAWFPLLATALWMAVVEATPDLWRGGDHETLLAVVKGAGLGLALLLGLRFGWRRDRFNPAFAFIVMFFTGLLHGLYPGLTYMSSLRSLIGSAAPFAFSFVQTGERFRLLVTRMAVMGPLVNVAVGGVLALLHVHPFYFVQIGVFRLAGAGQPAFLGGFSLIAIYAGLLEILHREATRQRIWPAYLLLAVNAFILLLTGARTPLALAALLILGTFLLRLQIMALAAAGVLMALAAVFVGQFSFIRSVNLLAGGQAADLSNRNLIWPDFEAAITASPWVGWGVGTGKQIVPATAGIGPLLGTTAAHNEYLRIGCEGGAFGVLLLVVCLGMWAYRGSKNLPRAQRWLMRLVFVAFAVHSATDNTLIATTSSVLFIWSSAVFSAAAKPTQEVA